VKPTSRKRTIRGVKEEATRLHSRIVRATKGPMCQACGGRPATDCAHIVGRTYSHTRTDEDNAFALCGTCHQRFDNWTDDRVALLERIIGMDEYARLKAKAEAGVNVKFDWYAELDRLRAVWAEIEGRAA
jgi:5-methylcytosine-specific restriction endonuclease McrA